MAAIFPQVDGDPVSTGFFATEGQSNWIGLDISARGQTSLSIAGLTQGGTVVDVDAKKDHRSRLTIKCRPLLLGK